MQLNKRVLVSGNFNILHPGHLRLLRFARDCGNRLIVAVNSDNIAGQAAMVPEKFRLEGVQSNSWVDEAFIMTESIEDVIRRIKPDIVVKGKEHEGRSNPEESALSEYGGKLIFSAGESVFSSVQLLRSEILNADFRSISKPIDYIDRHNIIFADVIKRVRSFNKLKVCVVGDLIVDEYITCDPLGMSQEDPTIVVTPVATNKFVGGAAIVAAHAAGLGAQVRFISIAGNDESRIFSSERLADYGVKSFLITDENRPTTLKQRFRSKGKTLLRVSHLSQAPISISLQEQFWEAVSAAFDDLDLLVFSDFNYGCLPQSLVDMIVTEGHRRGLMMVADSQASSQIGDVSRFKGMRLITPTEHEARLSIKNYSDGLVILAQRLREVAAADNILLKMGEEGVLVHSESMNDKSWHTDQVKALNSSPKDVAGAGDSMLIASALALASGANIWEASFLGSLAAAIQVGRVGNLPLTTEELFAELRS